MDGIAVSASPLGSWLISHGGRVHPALVWRQEASGHRVETTADLDGSTELISMPFDLAVTPKCAREALRLDQQDISDHQAMCLYLCASKAACNGSGSAISDRLRHQDYIGTLPLAEQMRTAIWMQDDEMALLAGTTLHAAVHTRRKDWQAEYDKLPKQDLQRWGLSSDTFSWDHYLWACTIISSRAFPSYILNGDKEHPTQVLLPCIDVFNHRRAEQVIWFTDYKTSDVQMLHEAPIKAGEEVFNNYGAKPNDELLLGYGFVLQDNPEDALSLVMGTAGDPALARLLEEGGLPLSKVHYITGSDTTLPPALLAQLRVLVADEAEQKVFEARLRLQQLSGGDKNNDVSSRVFAFLNWLNELETFAQLGTLLRAKLAALETTLSKIPSELNEPPRKKHKTNAGGEELRPDVVANIRIYVSGQVRVASHALQLHEKEQQRVLEDAEKAGIDIGGSGSESDVEDTE